VEQSWSQLHKYSACRHSSYTWQIKNDHKNRGLVSIQTVFSLFLYVTSNLLSILLSMFPSLFFFYFSAFFSYSFLIASYCSVYWHASQFCKIISVIRAIYTIKIKHRHLAINTVSLPNTPYQPHYVSPRVSFGADKNSHNTVPLYVIKFYIGTTL